MRTRVAILAVYALLHGAAVLLLLSGLVSVWAFLALLLGIHLTLVVPTLHPTNSLFGPNLTRMRAQPDKTVALTFDDGPHPEATPCILDILKREEVKATFFVVGSRAQRCPEVLSRIAKEGHAVGNHTDTHPNGFWAYSPRAIRRELSAAQESIRQAVGKKPVLFRAPVGIRNIFLHPALDASGLRLVSWSVRASDSFKSGAASIREKIVARARPGAIILLHDQRYNGQAALGTVEALPGIIGDLKKQNYEFVTLPSVAPQGLTR